MLLAKAFARGDVATRRRIYEFYISNTRAINNWDLVDISAPHIVGGWLAESSRPAQPARSVLARLAKSKSVWERRIAILATLYFIKKGEYAETPCIARLLLKNEEDLIHKAVGWMLREVGKRIGEDIEESFLKRHSRTMPRTMLRYAIEKFPEPKRKQYLRGEI